MDIKPASKNDIIDILYLVKKDMETCWQDSTFRLPMPDYEFLQKELEAGNLFILKHQSISVGTFLIRGKNPAEDNPAAPDEKTLWVERMAFASYWINGETIQAVLNYLEEEAKRKGCTRIRFNIHRKNEKMNAFYQKMDIPMVEEMQTNSTDPSYHQYEKTL
jgi:GNAT superfamily N-acetyltransferase